MLYIVIRNESLKPSIFIIGAGLLQIPLIQEAKKMGLGTIVSDYNPHAPGFSYADQSIQMSTRDIEGTVRTTRQLAQKFPILGVMTAGTDASMTVSAVAGALGFSGIRFQSALNATNKFLMRKQFQKYSVPSPSFIECWTWEEAQKAYLSLSSKTSSRKNARDLPFRSNDEKDNPLSVVVKPTMNMGARGVRQVNHESELESAFQNAKQNSPNGEVLIEEYMHGKELSIDTLIYNKQITITGVADRIIGYEPHFVEIGHILPSYQSEEVLREAVSVMKKGIHALGIDIGAAKGDLKITKEGVKIVEIAARLSGGFMSAYTYPYATGVNLLKNAILIAIGKKPEDLTPKYNRVSMEKSILPPKGYVSKIEGLKEVENIEGVKHVFIQVQEGDFIQAPNNNIEKAAHIIVVGENRDTAERIMKQAQETLKIQTVESFNPSKKARLENTKTLPKKTQKFKEKLPKNLYKKEEKEKEKKKKEEEVIFSTLDSNSIRLGSKIIPFDSSHSFNSSSPNSSDSNSTIPSDKNRKLLQRIDPKGHFSYYSNQNDLTKPLTLSESAQSSSSSKIEILPNSKNKFSKKEPQDTQEETPTEKQLALKRFNKTCFLCKICDGKRCQGEVPGMGGVGHAESFTNNLKALAKYSFKTRYLHEVRKPKLNKKLFGLDLSFPVLIAPVNGTKTNMGGGLEELEFIRAMTVGARKAGTISMAGDGASPEKYRIGLQAIQEIEGLGIPIFKPRVEQNEILKRIRDSEELGAIAVGIDIDAGVFSTMALKNQAVETKTVQQLKELIRSTHLPFILKGIMTREDALLALDTGAKALIVSNHGGRVLDSMPGTLEVLPEIVDAVKKNMTVMVDGGFRNGGDVLKGLCLGADFVCAGRPFAIKAYGGLEGSVFSLLEDWKKDLRQAMILTGLASVDLAHPNILRVKDTDS